MLHDPGKCVGSGKSRDHLPAFLRISTKFIHLFVENSNQCKVAPVCILDKNNPNIWDLTSAHLTGESKNG